jgi:5-methylcytosine-specific restriction enzyme A
MKINQELFPNIYNIAKKVYNGTYTLTDASKILSEEHGMNTNSARDYINDFKHLMNGEEFKRTLNAPSMKFLLEQIQKEYGEERLKKALTALDLHIKYYESCHSGELKKLRQVYNDFKQ